MSGTNAHRTTDQDRRARILAWRLYRAVQMQWTNTGPRIPVARHQIRVRRLRATWPQLAAALDGLAECTDLIDPGAPPPCPECQVGVESVHADVDPVPVTHVYRAHPCGHVITQDQAAECWYSNVDVVVTPINGSTLAAAERERQRTDEGCNIDNDLAQDPAELAWAVWCLLDRAASSPAHLPDPDAVPAMWPWSSEAWIAHASRDPLRLAVTVAALQQAYIDGLLALSDTSRR